MSDDPLNGFADYYVTTNTTPATFVVLVTLVVILSIALVAPFACLGNHRSNPPSGKLNTSGSSNPTHTASNLPHGTAASTSSSCSAEGGHHHSPSRISHSQPPANGSATNKLNDSMLQSMDQPRIRSRRQRIEESPNVADLSIFHRELLNAMKILATERRYGATAPPSGDLLFHSDPTPAYPFYQATHTNTSALSAIPSVATTSRLREPRKKRPLRSRMPWGRDQNPQPRLERIQRAVWLERQAAYSEGGSVHNSHAPRSQGSRHSAAAAGWPKSRIISPAATHVLEAEALEGEAEYYRQRWLHRRSPSNVSGSDVGSVMPPLSPSVISPQDAADANDPGRIPNPTQYYSSNSVTADDDSEEVGWKRLLGHVLDLAEVNFESSRILSLALGPTINAMAEPLFRMVLVAIISHFIDTDSMVAYVLVILFLRISTIEISGAIADAQSNMLQDAFFQRGGVAGLYQAGQVIQLSILFQVLIGVPVLLMWFFVMNPLVHWLVDDSHIAQVASSYTGVIMIDYLIRSASRSFMLPFHLTGQAQFEKNIDLMASFLTVVAIAIVATNFDLSLTAIGWIQVILSIAKVLTKIAYVILKGLIVPYRDGLVKAWACKDTASVISFLSQALPLFLGSLLELGEWEVLVLFVSHLGGAEVATWAVMGGIWEVLEAMTEGLGEAASVRVSYYLTEGLPHDARRLAHKVAFMSLILVLSVTSIFLMAGPNIAVTLSTDNTIQHLFSNLVGATGLANVSMTFAQIYWSLAGAQGRFGLASATILLCRWLVMLPIASICIFRYHLDLVSVGCAVALGYAIAACALAYAVFSSDWAHLASFLHEDLEPMEDGMDGYHDDCGILDEVDDDEEVESESSEGDEESENSEGSMLDEPKTRADGQSAVELDLL